MDNRRGFECMGAFSESRVVDFWWEVLLVFPRRAHDCGDDTSDKAKLFPRNTPD